ncbi:prenyltransferase/squalene oxidase repeat-containing protein [Conexibacter sp. CPCC 206217]|uniref:prenyltransferase/squalene oxidase repeat-containing protein n=1 Tax=Conexibacter sp. CPCC 206217 TaxID=3064574 RepID=UPI00271F0751|nr:prenyltransferase/squalene oxidase repeat-containing protein [Conexibacter sp. CPCC 206217]MDO8212204.1 terpene cyclase/mutase family protein [Conexibacter sp. CPCC 206217]
MPSLPKCRSAITLAFAALTCSLVALAFASRSSPAQPGDRLLDGTVAYMQQHQLRDGCFPIVPGGEGDPVVASPWTALALAAAGVNPREQFRPDGYRSVFDCIEASATRLENTTDLERTLLVVVAAGTDPRSFGGVDLVGGILRQQKDSGAFSRTFDAPETSSPVNTTIFAILSLALLRDPAVDAAIPRAADWLLSAQNDDGSWSDTSPHSNSSTDMTGAALQALRAAGRVNSGGTEDRASRAALERALEWLHAMQRDDGGFPLLVSENAGNSGSTAWVAQGLWAVGEAPTAAEWRRSGASVLDFLASLQRPDGHISWKVDDDMSPMWMTAYSMPAYAGRYLPIPPVPFTHKVPDPRNAPSPDRPADGIGGGSGGASNTPGGGVLAGGGGEGAPNFSRPRQGSKGRAIGGVRQTSVTRAVRRGRERTQSEQDRDPVDSEAPPQSEASAPPASGPAAAKPSAPARPDGGGADVDTGSTLRSGGSGGDSTRGRTTGSDAAAGEQVSGVLVGGDAAAGSRDVALAAAYGLRGAEAGGDAGPQLAVAIAIALLIAAAAGGFWERRREPSHDDERQGRSIATAAPTTT